MKKKHPLIKLAALATLATAQAHLSANVQLPAIFSDDMILQRSAQTPIWGTADPGETVTVTLGNIQAQATADEAGKWHVNLDLSHLPEAPGEMHVEGHNRLRIQGVAIGEVWLASGQSNMEWRLGMTEGAKEEIARGAGSGLREFRVEQAASPCPLGQLAGQWVRADPGKTAYFSGVAYYFGKTIHHATGLPVGIINASWGGTPVEAWMSKQALSQEPRLKTLLERVTRSVDTYPARKAAFVEAFGQWLQTTGREDHVANPAAFAAPDIDTSSWQTVTLPGTVTAEGLPRLGAVWLRKEVTLPERCEGREMEYEVNDITGFESVYWNGHKIGGIDYHSWPGTGGRRWYKIPAQYVKAGRNVLAVRLDAPVEPAAIRGYWNRLNGPQRVELKGPWLAKAEYALPDLTPRQKATAPASFAEPILERYRPSYLYNGMIHPLIPYGIRGVVWYQGENNVGDAALYRRAFPLLVQDWRSRWGEGDFPFYFCQLPNYKPKVDRPGESNWAELREAQAEALKLPKTGMAVLLGLGEANNIHPRNKAPVGQRLAALALADTYGKNILSRGPLFSGMRVEDDHIRICFTHAAGLTVASQPDKAPSPVPTVENQNGSALTGFAICGADRQWTWAEAKIDGDSVVVWSDQVPNPVAVRYAWADNPDGNLTNASGLPAAPFRTDGPQ